MLFGEAGRAMDRMRNLAAGHHALSSEWLMVVISHAELMHNAWRAARGEPLSMATEVEDHLKCVTAMQARCRQMLMQGGSVRH
ncbi:MAG: hypothetical protein EOO21_02695 [Comamonadaceae bacterium]|nr:MAG: hypothetical protein EOO21_02695 [Comamonadaceae bacterium]